MTEASSLLELRGITCRFPGGVVANRNIDLAVRQGEVCALLGENGAGKSTLMKVAFGMLQPSEGSVFWRGERMDFRSSADAMKRGIGMVHQHFMLIPRFRVWENIVLGQEPTRGARVDREQACKRVMELSEEYGLDVDPNALVEDLSVGEQQRVEILKALYRDIDLLILDEPTAVLTPRETEELFVTLKRLVSNGLAILFISHKLREVKALSHRIFIMRKGEKVADIPVEQCSEEELAALMVGRPPATVQRDRTLAQADPLEVVLSLSHLSALDNRKLPALRDVSLTLRRGEILGVAGVEGNGQSELIEAITGLRPLSSGDITLGGVAIEGMSPRQRYAAGLAHVPQDRQQQGLVLALTLSENILLGRHHEEGFSDGAFWLDHDALRKATDEAIQQFGIEPGDPDALARNLSGGNQQKVVVARELSRPSTRAYIVAHPTRGVDVGAIEAIHSQLLKRRSLGESILLFSSELPELLALCDRIAVLFEGEIVGVCDTKETSESELGFLMTGGGRAPASDDSNAVFGSNSSS